MNEMVFHGTMNWYPLLNRCLILGFHFLEQQQKQSTRDDNAVNADQPITTIIQSCGNGCFYSSASSLKAWNNRLKHQVSQAQSLEPGSFSGKQYSGIITFRYSLERLGYMTTTQ